MATSADFSLPSHQAGTPSDLGDLESQVRDKLHFTQHAALRCVTYNVEGETVVLFGRVPSYYLKQLAQVRVACIPGIQRIDNRIEVAVT